MKGQGQNIPLVTDTGSGLCTKAFFKAQFCTLLCTSTHSNGAGKLNPHGKRPGTAKIWWSQGSFPSTSGNKEYHIKMKQGGDPVKGWGQNIPLVSDTGSGLWMKAFIKLNPARVCVDKSTPMEQVTYTGEGLVQPNFENVKGVFPSTSGIKE